MAKKTTNDSLDVVVLKFADSKTPIFKEVRNKDYILYGERNEYPDYLTHLYNKSGTHGAIVDGKAKYTLGSGFKKKVPGPGLVDYVDVSGAVHPATPVNRNGETMFDVWVKSMKDVEIYGGFRWIVIWSLGGKVAEIYHDDFYKFRKGKDGGHYFKCNWSDSKEDAIFYEEFNAAPVEANPDGTTHLKGSQVFAYNEYRPGCDHYPLPGYIGANNYIEVDIEISKFHLSAIKNGMLPSKMIQFYTGEPSEDKKKEIERRLGDKFAGSENGGKFVLVFNSGKDKSVEITDLSFSDLDKQFDILNKTSQQQIFTGHQVTSPMLFGIKTEGQLGGTTELKIAYEIFINTYAKPKQANIEKITNYFGELMGQGNDYEIMQLDPVGIIIDAKDVLAQLPKEFIYDKLNIPKEYRGIPAPGMPGSTEPVQAGAVNDNIKNLTGKQNQQLNRILRQYDNGKLTKERAAVLLKTSLGLNDDEISELLGEQQEFSAALGEIESAELFSAFGDLKRDYDVIKSKKVNYSLEDAAEHEMHFRELDLTVTEASILDLIQKDKRITPEVIAQTINVEPGYVAGKIDSMTKRGLIESTTSTIGADTIIERSLTSPLSEIKPPDIDATTTEILVKYSYEVKPGAGPEIIPTTRPFCKKLIELDRLYSRAEIERVSERLGYSVFDRRGGWWGNEPTCRHFWSSNVVVRKRRK